jgi:hypothetical protein
VESRPCPQRWPWPPLPLATDTLAGFKELGSVTSWRNRSKIEATSIQEDAVVWDDPGTQKEHKWLFCTANGMANSSAHLVCFSALSAPDKKTKKVMWAGPNENAAVAVFFYLLLSL